MPSDKSHNAETIKGMIPEGAEAFKSKMNEEFSVTLDKEGVYGIKCTPHYGMGMVALDCRRPAGQRRRSQGRQADGQSEGPFRRIVRPGRGRQLADILPKALGGEAASAGRASLRRPPGHFFNRGYEDGHSETSILSQGQPSFPTDFRPFFLLGSAYAGLSILFWLPAYSGLVETFSAFAPVDWHIHEMLFGYLTAIVTGFLLTAIPNWTGRLPVLGLPLLALVLLWVAGRLAVFFSASIGWQVAAAIDVLFPCRLCAAAAAREIISGRNWRNLKVLMPLTILLVANFCFHLEAHLSGISDVSRRLGPDRRHPAHHDHRRTHYPELHPKLAGA